MIVVALGGNLPLPDGRGPQAGCQAALAALQADGIAVTGLSRYYATAPVPFDPAQPWFINAAATIETQLGPADLLARLHAIEAALGRVRTVRNASRPIDLDLILYGDRVQAADPAAGTPALPHPRLAERAFVVYPLVDLLPATWRHPVSGQSPTELVAALPPDQGIEAMAAQPPVPPPGAIDSPGEAE